ncbi:uncharacterized protein LOC110182273 [Drosophila serrata]|uniref:uncharacterized protein LOC110182273 n=1 Tax=Drosophila serrata TaxID=7274 RepID=UPI000A1D2397|nr:uncharacterized protein LOC110182273 [Drosophila serrata]
MRSDNFRLIAEVAKRRPLWDTNMAMACRKDEFLTQWACVAHHMQLDIITCKKRFKTLRDSYRAEVRKIQQKRISMSNWPYFRALEFLRHIFDPQCLVPFPPEPFDNGAELADNYDLSGLGDFSIDVDVDLDNDDSVDFEVIGDIFKREPSERQDSGSDLGSVTRQQQADSSTANKLPNSDPELSPRLLSPLHLPPNHASLPRPPPPSKRCRRRKTSSSCDGPISSGYSSSHQDMSKAAAVADAAMKDDSDYSFLVSLMPHLKSLSTMNNLKFRVEVNRLLMELNREELQRQPQERGLGGPNGLPKLTPAPDSSFATQQDQQHLSNSSYHYGNENHNGSVPSPSSSGYVDISMIECDVKIENEPLL